MSHVTTVAVKRMRVLAVVPVKGLSGSKNRLSKVLNAEERRDLMVAMLGDVLCALQGSVVREGLIVSPDSAVKEIADEFGFGFLVPKDAELNRSLEEAVGYAVCEKFDAVVILPADVPLVSPVDISKMVELGSEPSTVVLSGSMDGGTNALLLHPADVIPVCFGKDSFYKHVEEALKRDVKLRFYFSRETMLDVDSEDDLKKLREMKGEESKQVYKLLKTLEKKEN
jgi:2-phospho-L-lactate guanylyltransferase